MNRYLHRRACRAMAATPQLPGRRVGALRRGLVICMAGIVAGCAVGPDYQRPEMDVGERFKTAAATPSGAAHSDHGGWVLAEPSDDAIPAAWWRLFQDDAVDSMMQRLLDANQDLQQAEARYRQAQAALRSARSGYFPVVGSSVSATRSGSGAGTGGGGDAALPSRSGSLTQTQYSLTGNASWEPDLWGRVRRSVEGSRAGLDASAADLAATRLSLQSTLLQTWFRLRALTAETELMQRTVAAYERSLSLTTNRLAAGVAAPADVATATVQLENARVQLQALERQRAQLDHALAVLQGLPPSRHDASPQADLDLALPEVPVAIPARVLQRRPDVAAAERRVREANAAIGVAQAAWFPDLTLTAQGGFRSGEWAQWLTAPARFWSLGPALALTLFDGGARRARVDEARATHDAQTAAYRQTVLDALREVDDVLAGLASLDQEIGIQQRALDAARESLRLTRNQYEAGMIDYLSVMQVETAALNAERSALSLAADRLVMTTQLIAALGGGWDPVDRPD